MDAYSEDLRQKIVEALERRRMNKSEAAHAFGVSLSSVKRYAKAVREGRSLSPGKAAGKKDPSSTRRPGGSSRHMWRNVLSPSSQTGRSTWSGWQGLR
jgi:transposase-like protein